MLPAALVAVAVAAAGSRLWVSRRLTARLARLSRLSRDISRDRRPSVLRSGPGSRRWVRSLPEAYRAGLQGLGAAVAGGIAGARWLGPVGGGAGAAGGALLARQVVGATRRQRGRRMESQVPEAVELIAGALRSGRSTRQAIAAGASVGPPLGRLLADAAGAVELGRPLGDVLDELARAEPALAPSAAALRVGLVAGGDVARALDRLAEVTRQRLRLEGELGSLTAQVRLSGVVLGSLPLCALVLFSWAGPAAQRSFLREPWGQACLALGLLLDGAGFLLLQRLGRPAGVR